MSRNVAIDVKNLGMKYAKTEVLKNVNFQVKPGEVLVLLGPNGAGKTTTIEILEGFRKPSKGDVRVLGIDPMKGDDAWRARLGVVLQSWRDHSRWRVAELLEHVAKHYVPYSEPGRERPFSVKDVIEMTGLQKQTEKKLGELSGGQRRRMDVAIGLIGNPEVLFLDEPTVGFDPEARRDFHTMIHRLSDLENTAILLTTHDLSEAEKLADRIVILAGGEIITSGSAEQLAQEAGGQAEVRWVQDGQQFVHTTEDAVAFVRTLLSQHKTGIFDLQIQSATLEESYIKLVEKYENKNGARHE